MVLELQGRKKLYTSTTEEDMHEIQHKAWREEDSRGCDLGRRKKVQQQSTGSRLVLFTNDPGAHATTQ